MHGSKAVDVFGKTLDDTEALGQRGAARELKLPALLLQGPQTMHEPVVLLDEIGRLVKPLDDTIRVTRVIHPA